MHQNGSFFGYFECNQNQRTNKQNIILSLAESNGQLSTPVSGTPPSTTNTGTRQRTHSGSTTVTSTEISGERFGIAIYTDIHWGEIRDCDFHWDQRGRDSGMRLPLRSMGDKFGIATQVRPTCENSGLRLQTEDKLQLQRKIREFCQSTKTSP